MECFKKNGKVFATLKKQFLTQVIKPDFTPEAGQFKKATIFKRVDDGWLVGFNHGEFGAALYWFNHNGKSHYKISNHWIVDFFMLSDGIYAIEGLSHGNLSRGSVIRIAQSKKTKKWEVILVVQLPSTPCAVSIRKDGSVLLTLSNGLVSIGTDGKLRTLLENTGWEQFYPSSSILTTNEDKLYIGMRQYVVEYDITKSKIRFLIPNEGFLNKLPKQQEERIRKQFSQ